MSRSGGGGPDFVSTYEGGDENNDGLKTTSPCFGANLNEQYFISKRLYQGEQDEKGQEAALFGGSK